MSFKFIFGPSGSGKTYHLFHDVIERSMENPGINYIVIVPEQFTMQTQRDLVMMHPRQGIMNIDVLSFARLAHRIFDETGGNKRKALDDTGKSLILRKVAADREKELAVLSGNLHKPGYISEIKSVISEFVQYDIGENELSDIILRTQGKPVLQNKLKDIEILYKAFRGYMADRYITAEELLDIACVMAEQSQILKNSEIVFDGFTGFTPVQNRFLQRLMTICRRVSITITIGREENPYQMEGEHRLFYLSQKTVSSLENLAKEAGVPREKDTFLKEEPPYRFQNAPGIAFLSKNLFRFQGNRTEEAEGEQDNIKMAVGTNPGEEARWVAVQICRLIREKGYRYRDIAVISGDSETYAGAIENEFEKYGIPLFLDQTRGILLNPFTEMISSALEMISRNYTYESVFRYLRTGLCGFSHQDVDEMENYVRALGVRGKSAYHQKWVRRYKALTEEKLAHMDELREKLVEQFHPLEEVMTASGRRTCRALTESLYAFVVQNEVQYKLAVYENRFKTEGELAKAKEYGQIYRLIMELFDQITELLGEEEVTLKEYSEILTAGFDEIRVGIIPALVDQVVVGDMQRTRLKDIKALFFMGLNDGIIPGNGGAGGIISEIERQMLKEQNIELSPTAREQAYIQKLYLYMNVTKPSEYLFFSYARTGNNGKTLRPSYFVSVLHDLFPNLIAENAQEQFVLREILSEREGLDYLVAGLKDCEEDAFYELYRYYKSRQEYGELLNSLFQAAFESYQAEPIARAVSAALYGTVLENSVTRLEKFAACAYSHFLAFGLRLKERQEYSFETSDMGTVFHGVLEKYSHLLSESEYSWFDIPDEKSWEYVEVAMESYAVEYGGTILFSSARNEYMITRMKRILKRTVSALSEQVRKGRFIPSDYEISFSSMEDVATLNVALSPEEKLKIRGRIDRMDIYETPDKVYVKIIDYKSGNKSFDMVALYYGLELQLVVYLNAAMEIQKKRTAQKEVVPAGILYYHVEDPIIERSTLSSAEQMDEEAINRKIISALTMNGLVNSEEEIIRNMDMDCVTKSDIIPVSFLKSGGVAQSSSVASTEEFKWISDYVNHKVKELGSRILEGHIEVNPYQSGTDCSCTYCPYSGICGFDENSEGYQMRTFESMKREEVLQKIKEQMIGERQ